MSWFSKKPSPEESAKAAKKQVRSSQRDIDKEIRELERNEKKVMMDIKKRAKVAANNKDPTLRTLASQLVQIKSQREKLLKARASMGAMGMKASAMKTQVAMSKAIGSVAGTMKVANDAVSASNMSASFAEFAKQSEKMDLSEEMMNDALADAFDGDGVEEEADEITGQVLAELGLQLDGQMAEAPTSKLPVAEKEKVDEDAAADFLASELPDLQARLNAL
ncbi:hypothetical protein TrCOL_g4473 [Triparma columacea]|uniref:Uncharacterized protein n=1 Tax=Triparma columacea TaxID=722753 RepID=A0A9W7L2U8_9STRA|nr:hypothetical protein TrCOL_g4473 [Triparma columacea]